MSDWEVREEGGETWFENVVTGETTDAPPVDNPNFEGSVAYAGAWAAEEGNAWQEDTTGFAWNDTEGEWHQDEAYDPSSQTGLYDVAAAKSEGYFGEDGMWYPDQAIEDTLDELGTDIPTITSTLAPDMDEGLADGSYQDTAYQQTGYVDENTGLYYPDETGNEVDDWNHGGPHGEWPNGELEDTSGVYFGNSEGGGEGGNDEVGNGMYFDEETGDMYVAELDENGADGYYDAVGEWVDAVTGDVATDGYYDQDGNWIDPGTEAFYDANADWEDPNEYAEWEDPNSGAEWEDPNEYGEWEDSNSGAEWEDPNEYGEWEDPNADWEAYGLEATDDGYYDAAAGVWVEADDGGAAAAAEGYYDDDGQWVEPQGYVDEITGEWLDFSAEGYYDESTGEWVWPAEAQGAYQGYYDDEGNWIEAEASGDAPTQAIDNGEAVVEGYWDENGDWVDGPDPSNAESAVVVSVLRAVGLRALRLHDAADSYDALSISALIGSSKPYVTIRYADSEVDAATGLPTHLGRTPALKGHEGVVEWCVKTNVKGKPAGSEVIPKAIFTVPIHGTAQAGDILVEVWDGDDTTEGGAVQHLGRALLPANAVKEAAAHSYDEGGAGLTVSLKLRDLPFVEEKVAQGEVLVRIDPIGAPRASGMSEEELALAALSALENPDDNPFGHEEADAKFALAAAQSAEEREREEEEKAQAAREKAEAEAAAKAAAAAAAAEEEERRNAAPPPPPGHQDASPQELQWPLTDVFVADAMHNYIELLEDADMQPKDLKKYQDFLKEPLQYGEPHLRSGAKSWLQRNEDTKLAFQRALAQGLSVPEAEHAVLQEAKTWHWDISQGDIAAIPLQSQILRLDSRAPETAVLVPMLPLASSLPVPRVLDTPRTQLEAVDTANQALLVGSGALPFSPDGEDGPNSVAGGGGGAIGGIQNDSNGNPAQVLQLTDGSTKGGGASTTLALSGGPLRRGAPNAHVAERDGLGLVLDEQLPGLRSLAAYPWQVLEGKHPQTGRMQEYYYNVITKRAKWADPPEGRMWERKLALLQQLTPRAVDPTAVTRGLVPGGKPAEPPQWKWRETDAELRKRLRFLKLRDQKTKADEKRRRLNPTPREQVEEVMALMLRACQERDWRRRKREIHAKRRGMRESWHPATLGHSMDKLTVIMEPNPGATANTAVESAKAAGLTLAAPAPSPPPPPTTTTGASASASVGGAVGSASARAPTKATDKESLQKQQQQQLEPYLVTDEDLAAHVTDVRTTIGCGRVPSHPALRPRPLNYTWPPPLPDSLPKPPEFVKLDGSPISPRGGRHKNGSGGLAPGGGLGALSMSSLGSGSAFRPTKKSLSFLPSISTKLFSKRELEEKSVSTGGAGSFGSSSSSSSSTTQTQNLGSGGYLKHSTVGKAIQAVAEALEPTWHPEPIDHSAVLPLDAAQVTLELACTLPPRFEMKPNPMHEANMSRVARAWHQHRLQRKQLKMDKHGWQPAPKPHLWSQDEFNPTLEVFSTSARDAFEKTLCEDVARALGIPTRHVVIEEISGVRSSATAPADEEANDEVSKAARNTWVPPTDVEYSSDEEEEDEEEEEEEEKGENAPNDDDETSSENSVPRTDEVLGEGEVAVGTVESSSSVENETSTVVAAADEEGYNQEAAEGGEDNNSHNIEEGSKSEHSDTVDRDAQDSVNIESSDGNVENDSNAVNNIESNNDNNNGVGSFANPSLAEDTHNESTSHAETLPCPNAAEHSNPPSPAPPVAASSSLPSTSAPRLLNNSNNNRPFDPWASPSQPSSQFEPWMPPRFLAPAHRARDHNTNPNNVYNYGTTDAEEVVAAEIVAREAAAQTSAYQEALKVLEKKNLLPASSKVKRMKKSKGLSGEEASAPEPSHDNYGSNDRPESSEGGMTAAAAYAPADATDSEEGSEGGSEEEDGEKGTAGNQEAFSLPPITGSRADEEDGDVQSEHTMKKKSSKKKKRGTSSKSREEAEEAAILAAKLQASAVKAKAIQVLSTTAAQERAEQQRRVAAAEGIKTGPIGIAQAKAAWLAHRRKELSADGKDRVIVRLTILGGRSARAEAATKAAAEAEHAAQKKAEKDAEQAAWDEAHAKRSAKKKGANKRQSMSGETSGGDGDYNDDTTTNGGAASAAMGSGGVKPTETEPPEPWWVSVDQSIEPAWERVVRLNQQVRRYEPPAAEAMRRRHRIEARAIVFEADRALQAKHQAIASKFQKRREARLKELSERRMQQVAALQRANVAASAAVATEAAKSRVSQLPKGLPAGGRRRKQAEVAEAQRLAEAERTILEAQNAEATRQANALRQSSMEYAAERKQMLARLMAKETAAKAAATASDSAATATRIAAAASQHKAEASAWRAKERRRARAKDRARQKAAAAAIANAAARKAALRELAQGRMPSTSRLSGHFMNSSAAAADGSGVNHNENYDRGAAAAAGSAGDDDNDAAGTASAAAAGNYGEGAQEDQADPYASSSSGSEEEVDGNTGVARAVLHPSELATTALLEGHITCSVLRCGGLLDSSAGIKPQRWEGFWCHVISPVYFGRKGQNRIAGTLTKKVDSSATNNNINDDDGGSTSTKRTGMSQSQGLLMQSSSSSSQRPHHPNRVLRKPAPRDTYTRVRLVPDIRPGAAPGALVPKPPRKKKVLKPTARPSDPADVAREANSVWEKVTKGGKAIAVGHDGQKHLSGEQFAALKHKEIAMMKLKQADARQRRIDLASHLHTDPPWWQRPRRPMRRLTSQEVLRMTQGNDADALRARKAKLKALTLAKQKRALEVEMKRRRAILEVWLLNKLRLLSPEPDLFAEAMRIEAQREKAEKDAANGPPGGHIGVKGGKQVPKKLEANSEDLKANMAEMRRVKDEVESCERKAKNLFRDARKHFEVTCKATHKPTGELKSTVAKRSIGGDGDEGDEDEKGALTARSAKSSEASSSDDDDESDSSDEDEDEEMVEEDNDETGADQNVAPSPEDSNQDENEDEEQKKKQEKKHKKKKKKRVRKPAVVTPMEGDDDYEHPLPPPPPPPPEATSAPNSRPNGQPGDTSQSPPLSSSSAVDAAMAPTAVAAAAEASIASGKRVAAQAALPLDSDRAPAVPLLSKRALLELFFDQKSEWAQRAMGQKASRALVQKLEFEPCFVLHPVAIKKGFVTVDEFALFCVATHAILDKYETILERLAEIIQKREDEKNKFKIEAERRRLEERAKAAVFEATRRKGLLALQQKIMAARADPHASDDAWSKFHVHLIVQPVVGLPSYCCTCRRRQWEMVRNVRLAAEAAWRGNWPLEREHILRSRSKALERRVKRRLAQKPSAAVGSGSKEDKPLLKSLRQIEDEKEQLRQQRLPLRAQVFACLQRVLAGVERRVHENAEKDLRDEVASCVNGLADRVAEEWSWLELVRLEAEKDALIRSLTPTPPEHPETELPFSEGEESEGDANGEGIEDMGTVTSVIENKIELAEEGAPKGASSAPSKLKSMDGQMTALQDLPGGPAPAPAPAASTPAVAVSAPASCDSQGSRNALLATSSSASNFGAGAATDNNAIGGVPADSSSLDGAAAADGISFKSSTSSSDVLLPESLAPGHEKEAAPPLVMDAAQAEHLASLEAQLHVLRVGLGIVPPPPPPTDEELAAQAAAEADAAWHKGWDEMVSRCDLLLCFRSAATHHVTASVHVPAELMLTAPDLPDPNSPKKRRSQPPPPPKPDPGAVLLDRLWAATPEELDDHDEAHAGWHHPPPKKKLEFEPGDQGVLKVRLEPFQHHEHAEEHHDENGAAGAVGANSVSSGSHASSKASKKRKTKEGTTEAEATSGAAASASNNNSEGLQSHHEELRRATVMLSVHATSRDKLTGHPLSWRVKVKHVRGGEWWVQEFVSALAAEAHKIAHPELYPSTAGATGAASSPHSKHAQEGAGVSALGTVGEDDFDNEVGMRIEAHWQHREVSGDHRLLLQPPKWSRLDRKALKAQALRAARDKALSRAQKRSEAFVQGPSSPNKTKVLAAVVAATGSHTGIDNDEDDDDDEDEDDSSLSESSSSDEEATRIRLAQMPSLSAKVNAKRAAQEVERLVLKRQARLQRGPPRRWSVPSPPMPRWLAVLPKRRRKQSDNHSSGAAASRSLTRSSGLFAGSIAELRPRAAASAAAWKRSKEESGSFALVYRPPSEDSPEDVKRQGLGDIEELALEEELAGHGADAHLVAEAAKHYKGQMSAEMAAAVAKATAGTGEDVNLNGSMDGGEGGSKLKKVRGKGALKALLRGAAWLTVATLRTRQAATERRARALLEEAVRLREQMELQESERRAMAREEERTKRHEELGRRLLERKARARQEAGHRLFHMSIASLNRAPARVRRLQWVRALDHGGAGDSVLCQVRDPADGCMYLYRYLICPFEEDADFAIEQLRKHEDSLAGCPNVMRVIGASTSFASPWVSSSSGAQQGLVRCVVCVLGFAPGGQCADRVIAASELSQAKKAFQQLGKYPGDPGNQVVGHDELVAWARDAAAGLRALHAAGLTHRNLHPRNVHLDARGRAVLTSFQVLKNPRAPGDLYSWGRADCGSPLVLAPEVESGHSVTSAADMWALGVCVLAWCTGDVDGRGVTATAKERPLEDLLRAVPRRFGASVRSCLRMCLQHHPAKRASATDVWKVLSASKK